MNLNIPITEAQEGEIGFFSFCCSFAWGRIFGSTNIEFSKWVKSLYSFIKAEVPNENEFIRKNVSRITHSFGSFEIKEL